MSKHGFAVTFTDSLRNRDGVHRIRNWAEDLFREVTSRGWGTVESLDWSTDTVWVLASSPRASGDLAKVIRRTLRKNHLLDDAVINKLAADEDWREYQAFMATHE